jgi:cytochrome c oxidase assembly factor 2
MTSSLFATTVFASFFVVALPHILPCPAPRVKYADGEMPPEGKQRRRRRKPEITETAEGNIVDFGSSSSSEEDGLKTARTKRECPVPKPGGAVGELLGFRKTTDKDSRQGPDQVSR